jgi:uncharacterized membrane protein
MQFIISFTGSVAGSILRIILVSLVYAWKENRRLAKMNIKYEKPKKQKGIDPKQTGKPSKR